MAEKKYGPRKDLGAPAEVWLKKLSPDHVKIAEALRKAIRSADRGLEESVKWGNLAYTQNGMVAGIMASKNHVSLFLHKGSELKDPKKLLAGSGKAIRSLKLTDARQIPKQQVKAWIKAAVKLND